MLFNKNSFRSKIRQDFSELYKFLDNKAAFGDPFETNNKSFAVSDNLHFNLRAKEAKDPPKIPYFENPREVSSELLLLQSMDFYYYFVDVFRFWKSIIFFLTLAAGSIFIYYHPTTVFSFYTFYFFNYIYDLEDFFNYLSNIFK
jgi:hypothetical protein